MNKQYFEEDVLVEKVQSGEMNVLDYVTHHSKMWDEEFAEFCQERNLEADAVGSAEQFLQYKDELMCKAHIDGNI